MSKCVVQSKLVLNGWIIIKLSNNGKNVYDVTLGPTDLVCRGLVGPAHTAELNRDV